jgi:hypothetical protein
MLKEVKVERERVEGKKWKVKVIGMNLVIRGLSPPKREKG